MSLDKQICRTCLATETELLSICAVISNDCRVIDYFNECLKISIINNDNLPQSICLSCLDNLLEVKKFHEKCIRSENYFKQQQQTNINNDICNDEWSINNKSRNQIKKEFINTEVFDAQKNYDESDAANEYFVEEIIEYEMLDNLDNTSNETQKIVEVETETESTTKNKHKAITESFYCIECNECFKYEKNYNLHIKSEHDIKNNENVRQQDDDDSKTIEFTENEAQNDMKKFRCELCGWFFKFRSNFIFHMRRHKQNNEFTMKCPYPDCKKEFFTSRSLRDHATKAHVGDDESLLCPYCGLKLETKRELRRHLHRHNTGVRKYKCKFCGKLFSHKEHHRIHERIHTGERPFKCQYCKKTFKQSSTLNTHLTLHTGKPIKCQICSKRFSRNGFLRVHMRIHNDDKPYACEFCPLRYYQKCHLDSHLAIHSSERPFKCCVCGTRFAKKEILRSHYYIHAPKPYKCPECTLETASGACLRKHLKNVHHFEDDIEKYKRTIVVKKSPEIDALIYSTLEQSNTEVSSIKEESQCLKNKLEKHLEKNHANSNENTLTLKGESIRIQCSKCDRKFCTEKAVKRHYLAIHKNKNPNIHCPHCGNFQLSPEDLDHHLELGGCTEKVKKKIRIDKKKYNCKYCNKLFSHKDYCKTHERIHTGERPFKCQYCEKAFKQSSTLYTHLKLHTGKNISCTLCDKKFTRESVLKIHMRRHTEERPYVCELCPQNYTQKCHLQTHIQTAHSIEKPYKCDFCYMEFSRKDLFRIHIFTHIGKPYKCPECSVEYSVSYRFRKHLINVHGIYEDPSNFKRDIIYDPNTLREINDIMNEHNITTIQNEKN